MRPLLQGDFPAGGGRLLGGPARPSAGFPCATLVLFLLWAFSAGCAASDTPAPAASRLPTTPRALDQGGAVADLDGDGRPDLAIVKEKGWGPKGFQYQIELDLTTRVDPSFFDLSAKKGGLRIVPRDVDGDQHLDLVILNAWSLAPVGVWINDGHGGFTQGDPTVYSQSIWSQGPGISSDTPRETFQATVPDSHRCSGDLSAGSYFCNELRSERLSVLLPVANPSSVAVSQPPARGPPHSLPEQPSYC